MSLRTTQQRLSTRRGFSKAATAKSSLPIWGWTSIALGVAGVVYNFYELFRRFGFDLGAVFGNFFSSRQQLEPTSMFGFLDVLRFAAIWAPVVLIPLGLILLLVRNLQKRGAGVGHYDAYAHGGWVGRMRYTALHLPHGGTLVPIAFISHPAIDDAAYESAVSAFSTSVDAMTEEDRRTLAQTAEKAGVLKGAIPAELVDPATPAGLVAVAGIAPSEWVAVVPPINGHGRTAVVPLRRP